MSTPQQPSVAGLLEEARAALREGRHDDAASTLAGVLEAHPAQAVAHLLMAETLFARERIADAAPHLDIALAAIPANPRLHILRGEMRLAQGDTAAAGESFREALRHDASRVGAWAALMRLHIACADWPAVLEVLCEAVAATGAVGIWRSAVHALQLQGPADALDEALDLFPVPAASDADRFPVWARWMIGAGERARLAVFPPELPATQPADVRAQYLLLMADAARTGGDFVAAHRLVTAARGLLPHDPAIARQCLRDMLAVGDVAAAEGVLKALAADAAQSRDLFAELRLMDEARVFRLAMDSLRDALHASVEDRLPALARLLAEEPGCLFAAIAFLGEFRRLSVPCGRGESAATVRAATGAGRAATGAGMRAIPDRFWSPQVPAPGWREWHPGVQWRDLAPASLPAGLPRQLPVTRDSFVMLPSDKRLDLLRPDVLWREGGWWCATDRRCRGDVRALASPDTTLFAVCDAQGWLLTEGLGCIAGEPAMDAVRRLLADEFRFGAPRGGSRWRTGAVLLTLGVAGEIARRVVAGVSTAGVQLVDEAYYRRRVG